MVQSSSNIEKKKWQTRQKISREVSKWKMIWSKIFDLKKEVFACETVAFIKKYLAIAA